MKLPTATIALLSLGMAAEAQEDPAFPRVAPAIVHETTPGLGDFTDRILFAEVWERTDLAPRDRSLVTISALVAAGQTAQMTGHVNRGLDNGLQPGEIAGVITHLAFYSGWPRAMTAVAVAKDVFAQRGIAASARTNGTDIELDPESERQRSAAVQDQVGEVAPALADYTNRVLFGEVWTKADLSARDRSLVTVTALIVGGQAEQLPFHLNRGLDNGLTQTELTETITHLAFYAGWPRAMSAIPVAKTVFEGRADAAETTGPTDGASAEIDVLRAGSQPSTQGPATNFIGTVRVDSRFQRKMPARIGGGTVTFQPGARTAWHTHPLGQSLFVTAGCGLVQREGGPIETIRPGDVVWIPPQVKHWHGATPDQPMTHIAISESLDGKAVDWLEQVSDQQYAAPAPGSAC